MSPATAVRPYSMAPMLAVLLLILLAATAAFIPLSAPGSRVDGIRRGVGGWRQVGARARPVPSDVRMCITGLAAPFAWRKGVRSSRHQAVRQDAAQQQPPVRASTRRPFSLARAVLLGPFAFEVYNDPPQDQGRRQLWSQDTEVAVLDDQFLAEVYGGQVTVRVLSVREAGQQPGAGGAAAGKVLGHAKQAATDSWLPNLLGFGAASEAAGGESAKAQQPSATTAVLGYTMGEGCSGSVPMSLVAAGSSPRTAAASSSFSSYVARPVSQPQAGEGVSFSACVRRSSPATSLNLTLSLEEDKTLLGRAAVDLRALVPQKEGGHAAVAVVEQEVQLEGGEGGLVVRLELAFMPFPLPTSSPSSSSSPAAAKQVSAEGEQWLGAKGCSRDWRQLGRVVGEEGVSGKDMRLLAFVENRATDAQLKVWRDERRKRLIVAFRGTDPTRLGDLIIDLKLLQEPWDVSKLDKQQAPPASPAAAHEAAEEAAAAKKRAEDAWMADLYSSLAWQANVTGMMFNELANSLSTASYSYLDYFKRAIGSTTVIPPSAPLPPSTSRRGPSASSSSSSCTDSTAGGLISPRAVQLLQPPQLDYHHRQQQPGSSPLPSAVTAPELRLTPDSSSSSSPPPPPPAPRESRRRMLFWSRRLSRSYSQAMAALPPPPAPSSPSVVDQAVADVFTSVLDRVLGRMDPSATTFLQREGGRVLSVGDFRRAFIEVVGRASEHLGSQVLTTWAEMQQQQASTTTTAAQQTVLDLLVLVGQAGSSPLVMLPTRFRHVFESLVHETLLSLKNDEPSTLQQTATATSSSSSAPRRSKRTRLLSLAASSFQRVKANLTTQPPAPPQRTAVETGGEAGGPEEHPSQGDFRVLLLGGLDSVLASLQEKQVGAFNATGLPLLSAEAFGVSPLPHVHSGFKEAYLSVRRPLLDLLHTAAGGEGKLAEEGWEVLCTGHSMGGSLAMLLAHELSEALPRNNRISMYSFGQPRTGNSAFAARYDRANGDSFRIVNEWDVIARFPRAQNASVFDYEHAARTVLPNYLGCDEGIWVEGEQPGQCPLRDLRPLEPPGPDGAAPSRLPANLSPLFLAAEWNLLNSLLTGSALSSHLEYRYLEGLEGGLRRKAEAESARARRLAEQLLAQQQEQQAAAEEEARLRQGGRDKGSSSSGQWVPKVVVV